jgi:hypothetical protein
VSFNQEISDRVLAAVIDFASSINSGGSAPPDMSSLIDATSPLTLTNLDDWERLIRGGIYSAKNSQKPPKWKFWTTPTPFPTWIDLCNGDGFQRERTLRALTGSAPNGFFFALAVRRLNDWVPEVRTAAREELPSIAAASDPAHVASVVCSILPHWNSWGRMDACDKQILLDIASTEAVARHLKSQIIATAAGPIAEVLAQAGRTPALDACLQEIASGAVQPAVRAKAYRALIEGKMIWLEGRKWEWTDIRYCKGHLRAVHGYRMLSTDISRQVTLKAAISDRSAHVRSVVGNVLIRESESLGPLATELATQLASDKHPALAARGDFLLKRHTQLAPGT